MCSAHSRLIGTVEDREGGEGCEVCRIGRKGRRSRWWSRIQRTPGDQIAAQETCRADIDAKCGDAASNDCEGKFFPGFTKINYEGPTSKRALAYKWYNIEEVILIKKMKGTAMLWVDKEKREINEKARRNWQNHDKGRALQ
ncbi:uncharacterized protein [Aegilops tauschii subsp. strangulata]|uniref:uncharacterized protein n=1 Tax=Triticum aestivum TaxID=4565 RepID=UPI001ABCCEDB|nr:uncharacterized protein LOC123122372 [Triticum aestivum]